jgi:predicted nuclease of predicted toxin-antitoxin system
MRLLDENFPRPVIQVLRRLGHDVLWARTDCQGLTGLALLERAEADGRILLTLDKDFWQLALQRRLPLSRSGVILFRAHPATPEHLEPVVDSALMMKHSWVGQLSIVTEDGIEMIRAGGR